MPFTLFSHQAPVLPLKLWRPRWFSATALLVGSMAPDLEYFFLARPDPERGHTVLGQLTFCLPLTLAVTYLLRRVARPLAAHLPDGGALHLRDFAVLGRVRPSFADGLRVAASALVGSLSHLFLDGFTHERGWATERLPALANRVEVVGHSMHAFRVLQYGGSLLLFLATVAMLLHVGRNRLLLRWSGVEAGEIREDLATVQTSAATFWGVALAVGLIGGGLRLAHDLRFEPWSRPIFVGHAVLQFVCYVFVGTIVASAAVRLRAAPVRNADARNADARP